MDLVAVLAGQQQLRVDTVFYHVRRAPFGRNHRVVSQLPPEVVSQLLWATILFPGALQVKRVRVHQEDATRAISASRPEGAPVDAVWSTMKCMRRRIAGLLYKLFGLDHLHNLWLLGIRLRIQDVDPGRPDARDDQVAAFHVCMRGLRAETRAARVPAE